MGKSRFTVVGHSIRRFFTYTEKKNRLGHYLCREYALFGGAALLAGLLGIEEVAPADGVASERLRLYRYATRKDPYFAVNDSMGISSEDVVEESFGDGEMAVVWAEGDMRLPKGDVVMWASKVTLPRREQLPHIDFLMLDADMLREKGAKISRGASWERTVIDLAQQMKFHSALCDLLSVPRVLITFAEDGAVLFDRDAQGSLRATLYLTHGKNEGNLRQNKKIAPGKMPDTFLVMVAAAARLYGSDHCVKAILQAGERLLLEGYEVADGAIRIPEGVFAGLDRAACSCCAKHITIPLNPQTGLIYEGWNIARDSLDKNIWGMLTTTAYFQDGIPDVLPRLVFENLTTVDRYEIERYQDIYSLIRKYEALRADVKPLSFAVFGRPGSGKSFGIKEILKSLGDGFAAVTYNVSQFTSESDVLSAFQEARSLVLKGKLPVLFFDEFDSERAGQPLGWIKSFLMPMQDGTIFDSGMEQPVGKCIMVFAGGTAATFEEFILPLAHAKASNENERRSFEGFVNAKGPDFVSRLRGTLDILGPNKQNHGDGNYLLRRAVLLNGLLRRRRLRLTPNVHEAMLLVPEYKNGARSMEQILEMSSPVDDKINAACLPSEAQLALHVDAGMFMTLVLLDESEKGAMARKIHELYLSHLDMDQEAAIGNAPSQAAWEDLSTEEKLTNVNQMEKYAEWAEAMGGFIDRTGLASEPVSEEAVRAFAKVNAEAEHISWCESRMRAGWTSGPKRDNVRKVNPVLIPWDKLDRYTQAKDVYPVVEMPEVLLIVGKGVYRNAQVEADAKALHEYYRTQYPTLAGWDALTEAVRQRSRAQIVAFGKLHRRHGEDVEALARGVYSVWAAYTGDGEHRTADDYDALGEQERQRAQDAVGFLLRRRK